MDTRNNSFNTASTNPSRLTNDAPKSHASSERGSYWRKDQLIRKHAKTGKPLTSGLANQVLFDGRPVVMDQHLGLCKTIVDAGKTVPLPVPGTPSSEAFTPIGGQNSSKTERVPGGYFIDSPNGTYAGQAVHLGRRARVHGNGTTNTAEWLAPVASQATITVYPLSTVNDYLGLVEKELLCLLELYLMVLHRPTHGTYMPTPGFNQDPETLKAQAEAKSTPLYAYRAKESGVMTLLYVSTGHRDMCRSLRKASSFISSLMTRSEGWYRGRLLFTSVRLTDDEPIMTIEQLVEYMAVLKDSTRANHPSGYQPGESHAPGYAVTATDTHTGKELPFKSKRRAAEYFHCNRSTLVNRHNDGLLLDNRYRIAIHDKLEPT